MTVNERLNQLQSYLEKQNVDIALITTPANVFYYTGFQCEPHERFLALVVDRKMEKTTLFVPALDKDMAQQQSSITNIIGISDEQSPFDVLQDNVATDVQTVGIEMKTMNVFQYNHMQSVFSNATFTDVQPQVNRQRLVKSKEEIDYMVEAVHIIEKVYEEGIKKVKEGMTEAELVAELEYLMRKFGADGPSFSTIALFGENAALPHGAPGSRKLKKGDFILIDMGVIKDGYCSDMTRTFVFQEASEKQKEIYNIVLEATNAGIDAVKAGVPLKTFDIASRNVIKEKGYDAYFNNRVGHGLGIDVHEEPSIHENNEEIAEKGYVFTIEPGIYIPDFGGVRIEDEVYINEKGDVEVLTSFPKELQII
ncbi:aminopeptidase P family protein [Cerasibacillus terrae]|uniref:Aminopeptidase P family protein n=1 Tax=Cerasibacillus terrae TaxID=2498845 RepID=A0A5C8NZS7_9BACI|nr:Xaa-Pro peptidase family protein [Cerasibacillus terrae]TXL66848.1 aminopeptidase P family protein [Cerasibacillus terrae]